jgi:hypothetical protein
MAEQLIIPAVTLWQPYACLIEIGAKPYETRSFQPPRRLMGKRIAIHAAARKIRHSDFDDETADAIGDAFGHCLWFDSLPLGVVVCTAILAEAVPAPRVQYDHFGDYRAGRWAWRLDDVRPVKPHVPAKGQQMIGWPWTVPDSQRSAHLDAAR